MEAPITKFTIFMCLLKGICSLSFGSCLQLYWEYRQKEKSRGLYHPNTLKRQETGRSTAAHSPCPGEGPCWQARGDPQRTPGHTAVSRMSHPGTHAAPFPNSSKASFIASLPSYTASLISASRIGSLLFRSALPRPSHHIPVRLCLTILARA